MKKINLYKIFAILFIAISTSCVDNNDFVLPTVGEDKEYTNLMPLSDIVALYNGGVVDFDQYIEDNNLEDINTYGYVISDDREGNYFKTLIIQDKAENPTVGVEIRIDATNLNAVYNVGRKVYIKLKGLALSKYFTNFQIGANGGTSVDRIDESEYRNHIERSSELTDIVPTTLKIGELTDNLINTLVKIENVQSDQKGLTYADPNSTFSVNRTFKSCETFEKIIMRTSGFANFKSFLIPDMKGSVTAVLGKFSSDYQLYIRDTNDVNFTQEYGCNNNPTAATLAEIKALYTGSETTITQNSKIKIVVTSDLSKANTSNRNAFGQDASAGIALRFSDTYNLNLGDEIEIAVGGLKLSEFRGLLQLNLSTGDIISNTPGTLPTPEVITIAQALTGDYQGKLVSIEGVQFKDITKTYSGSNEFTSDCTDALATFVSSSATFAGDQVSDKKGTVTGVMSSFNSPQIYIRDTTDVNFTEDYACGSTTPAGPAKIFFSELADPNNEFGARFIEIYNAGTENIDLTGWTLRRYTNGSTTPSSSSIDLTGNTINAAQAFVIAADATKFQATFGFAPDLTEGAANTNGDDNFELVNPSGQVVDVFGVPGEDGSNTNHEFEDGRAYRKASVTEGNPTYTFSEWDIWNDTGAAGTTNAPQDAPGNFTPGVR
ncbi:Lamin tail domain-containing protein [Tenacibaculum sp. 190130A14a]|uniref:Lamin tail domain-containing protein n=1 Tax=Tenacibaculum polynesiense TaxID=3137857 RepID=A0ABM9PEY3_9FLAO